MPLEGVVDLAEQAKRLSKQVEQLEKGLAGIDRKLANENFVSRAPAEVVARERTRRQELAGKLAQARELLASLPQSG